MCEWGIGEEVGEGCWLGGMGLELGDRRCGG